MIVGASVRSAALSALRAGVRPLARDLFGDRDLHGTDTPLEAIGPALYPLGFEAEVANSPPGCPWIYTGALENHPELIDRMARLRPLWGVSGDALRACRDPLAVARAMASRGLPAPGVRLSAEGVPRDGSWLGKPLASAGGRQVRPWVEGSVASARPLYFQERIDGTSLAALFVADRREVALMGVTRQRLSRGDHPFAYEGSLGPWPISGRAREGIVAMGQGLAGEFGVLGLFGVDLILTPEDDPYLVEVNPRYTASVEVLELATGRSLLRDHARAFGANLGAFGRPRAHPPAFVGKAILFAESRGTLPAIDSWRARFSSAGSFAVPDVADIPAVGQTFDAGDPVLTVLCRGSSLERCDTRLERHLERWKSRLVQER